MRVNRQRWRQGVLVEGPVGREPWEGCAVGACAGGTGERQARRAQLNFVVKAVAPLWGLQAEGNRGMSSWVIGESGAPPALAPRSMRPMGQRNDGLG